MVDILIQHVPNSLFKKLQVRAALNGRTVSKEALVLLVEALVAQAPRRPTLKEIRAVRIKTSKPLTQEFFDQARNSGRP